MFAVWSVRATCRRSFTSFNTFTLAYGSLKVEGVLNIVVRSRYERDLDHLQ